jgi:hypothetical protein
MEEWHNQESRKVHGRPQYNRVIIQIPVITWTSRSGMNADKKFYFRIE